MWDWKGVNQCLLTLGSYNYKYSSSNAALDPSVNCRWLRVRQLACKASRSFMNTLCGLEA
jgi:hypothetical protein